MNQRRGKTYRAAPGDDSNAMAVRNFFRTAKELLEGEGHADAAFYFGQLEDHMTEGGSLRVDRKTLSTILGL